MMAATKTAAAVVVVVRCWFLLQQCHWQLFFSQQQSNLLLQKSLCSQPRQCNAKVESRAASKSEGVKARQTTET